MTQEDDLISLTECPTAPMPWVTKKPGDAYVCEDYVLLFQVEPPTIVDGISAISAIVGKKGKGELVPPSSAMTYLYSLSVLYRRQVNPSARPVRLFGLEQVDVTKVPPDLRDLAADSMRPMIGEFTPTGHLNYGEYSGRLVYGDVREALLECAKRSLRLTGEPEWIGTVADAKGHPKTGIEKGPLDVAVARKSGCLSCIAVVTGAALLGLDLLH